MRIKSTNIKWLTICLAMTLVTACQSTSGTSSSGTHTDKQKVAQTRTALAGEYIRDNKLDAAQRQIEMALAANSRHAPAYNMMGVLLQTEGSQPNLVKADGYFRRAIDIDPQLMQARNNYGVYLSQMGRHQEAAAQFELAGGALGYEGRLASLENLGKTYLVLGDTQKATDTFSRVLDSNSNSLTARVEMVSLLLAQGQTLRAKQLYDETVSLWGKADMPPRLLFQGIQIAIVSANATQRQRLSQQLLSSYPLSDEAKRLKVWLANPTTTLR
ncbi:MAG: type IV pilus biogenesis/stability protein PilW [Moraxella sp.]|nr:type IV pilus biogenesis/stability protein PilW [Moraxella sp.]